jgi:hypothetical protein
VSVSPELQDAVARVWAKHLPDLAQIVKFWRWMEIQGLLTPSWSLTDGEMTLVKSIGGIHSGLKLTSEFGTFLNIAATLYALECCQAGRATDWPNQTSFTIYIFGDDGRVATDSDLDVDEWTAAFARLGLKCVVIEGGVFLSRYTLPTLSDAPVAGRVIQQFMSNEKEYVGEGAKGLAYLGAIARTQGCEKWPAVMQEQAWAVIKLADWIQRLPKRFSGLTDLREYLQTNDQVKKEIAYALYLREGSDWYSDRVRAAEHSPTAALEVAIADHAFARLGALIKARDTVTLAICTQAAQKPASWRLSAAREGFEEVTSSKKDGLKWLKKVASEMGEMITFDELKELTHNEPNYKN